MLTLALETSTRHASAALGETGAEPLAAALTGERPHLSDLLPLVAELFERAGRTPRELGVVFVGIGPGSYTGLRVGISTALGLAVGPDPPDLFGVPSPEALFFGALEVGETGLWLSDARAGTWYRAKARREDTGLTIQAAPELIASAELVLPEDTRLFTDAPSLTTLAKQLSAPELADFEVREPLASDLFALGLARRAAGGAPTPPNQLAPLYLREFAAKVRTR
jgi:tRNA threonylcarbamoyl adenosine modification protein YeaZ